MFRRLLIALISAVAFIGVAAGAHAQQACNGQADLCSRPFSEVVFPGTHNSMAADDYGWSFAITTQTHTMRHQLDNGIRALSIDIHYAHPGFLGGVYNADGPTRGIIEPYLCHSQCVLGSMKATSGFNEIAGFLHDNPDEVIVVYVEDYVSPSDLRQSLQASNLWQYVNDGPLTRTLGDMIASGKRAVFIAQNQRSGEAWYPKLTDIGRDTDYDFSSTSQLTDPANHWNTCRPTPWGAAGHGRILVMQHFVTPTTTGSWSASDVVNQPDVITSRALRCRDRTGVMPSLLLVDYYEFGDVVGAARTLNSMYVAPEVGTPGCSDISSCGTDPARPEPGRPGATRGGGSSAAGAARVSRIGLLIRGRRAIAPGRTLRMRVSAHNAGTAAAEIPVALVASRPRAVTLPAEVTVMAPAGGTGERTVTIRVKPRARPGAVTIAAEVAGASKQASFTVARARRGATSVR